MKYNWSYEEIDPELLTEYMQQLNVSKILASKLIHKNMSIDVALWILEHSYEFIDEPIYMQNMDRAAALLSEYILKKKAVIMIFGDYDTDGLTSTTILCRALTQISSQLNPDGEIELYYHVPERAEGYGLSVKFAEGFCEIAKRQPDVPHLLITVDNGITAKPAVDILQTAPNMEILITDHHLPDYENNLTPEHCICVDPNIEENSPGKCLAGCGVIFNLLRYLENMLRLEHDVTDSLLYLAAIGTIGDMMDINLYHACLIVQGMDQINSAFCPLWLQRMKELAKLQKVTSKSVSFSISPFLNSCGQMGDAKIALRMLLCDDPEKIQQYVDAIYAIYNENHIMTKQAKDKVAEEIENLLKEGHKIILYPMQTEHPGIVSKVATSIGKMFGIPIIMWGETKENAKDELVAGSARNDTGFPIMNMAKEAVKMGLLNHAEGHKYAFGVGILRSKVAELQKFMDDKLQAYEKKYGDQAVVYNKNIDCIISTKDVNVANMVDLERFPFCRNLEAPIVMIKGAAIKNVRVSSYNTRNLEYTIQSPDSSYPVSIWAWNINPEQYDKTKHTKIDMIGTIERNFMKPNYATIQVMDLYCY